MDDMRTYPDPIIAGLAYDLEIVTEPDGQVVRVELTPVIDGANTLDDYGVTVEDPTVPGRGETAHTWVLDHIVPGMAATAREHLASLKPVIDAAWLAHTGTTTGEVPS